MLPETLAVRAGQLRTEYGAHSEPIFATSSFVFENAAQAARRFAGEEAGCIYSRFTNPTVQAFEEKLAAMEGAERAIATASGMSAIFAACIAFLKTGDKILASRSIFGTTYNLFNNWLPRFGISTEFVGLTDYSAWESAMDSKTRLIFLETPSNPLSEIADIRKIAEMAHRHGILLAVDNCFCTPALQLPFTLGADIVIHSATKFLDGQGRTLGGAVLGSQTLMTEVFNVVRTCGPCMSPFNAWVALKGLETLGLRMREQSRSALALAQWLQSQPNVKSVYYAGLENHPQHTLARQQQKAFGAVLAFEVQGGREEAWRCIDQTRLFSITANLGDVKSTITHPATTTHGRLSDEDKRRAGITEGLIRLSVGLEAVEDLKRDLELGLSWND